MYYFIFLLLLFFLFRFSGYHIIVYLIDKTAHFLAYIFVNVDSSRRKIAKYNIELVFPEYSESKVNNILFKSTKISIINGLNAILGRLLYVTNHYKSIKYNIPEQMIKEIDDKGIIMVLSHFGLFLEGKYLGKFTNREMYWVYKIQKWLSNLIYPDNYYHKTFGILYQSKKTFNDLIKINNGIIGLACDQKAYNTDKKIKFLNQLLTFHYGPALLSLKTKRKIWYINIRYDLDTKKQIWKFINISNQLSQKSSSYEITQKIADILTQDILEHPEQYFWLHDRFNYRNR
jgi:lauroyl/myristoyl acyltransferase